MAGRFGRRCIKEEDFEEGDVWNVMEEKENSKSPIPRKPNNKSDSSFAISRHFSSSSTPRMIPRSSSSSIEAAPSKQFSAPVDIPDWSKIYGKSSNKKKNKNITSSSSSSSSTWVDVDHCHNHDGYYVNDDDDHGHNGFLGCNDCDDYDDDCDGYDDDDDGMVPPHEYLARKLARNQISSFSVYEGIGRTLKGRDLSKLRNAILTKTGFLE